LTLLELMFASGILAVAFSVLFGSLVTLTTAGQLTEGRMDASAALATVMEDVATLNYSSLVKYTPPILAKPGTSRTIKVELLVPKTGGGTTPVALPLSSTYTGTVPNPVEVRTTLQWVESRGYVLQAVASTMKGY
jgi:hypothetical protein